MPEHGGDQVTGAHAEPLASLAAAFDAEERQASAIKVAVCEYLISVNDERPLHPLVPPTALNWLGDGLTSAVLRALRGTS